MPSQRARLSPLPLALLGAALLLNASCSRRPSADSLPKMGQIPAFTMDDQRHAHVSDETLRGNVLVVDFFFAHCTTSCPLLTSRMAGVQRAIAASEKGGRLPIHLVSITLDPENDTPDELAKYATNAGADFDRWSFLSGRSEELDRVVTKGFKMAFEKAPPSAGIATIMHGEWIVLVDKEGKIRGYYPAHDDERMTALANDAIALAGSPGPNKESVAKGAATSAAKSDEERHAARGKVVSFGEGHKFVNIAHDDIPGYMKAMTMSFVPKAPADLDGYAVGDRIEFEFIETEDARRLITSLKHGE